ncbi:hypothetical protein L9F63_000821, partial [Diploptera punctata]
IHSYEQQVIEERKAIDVLKKGCGIKHKENKNNNSISDQQVHCLIEFNFLREKQQRLNEVMCLVILKLDQLLSLKEDSDKLEPIDKTLVFSKEALKQLQTRIGELGKETEAQKEVHMQNRKHLHRLKLDCQHMTEQIKLLKDEIAECMYRKFNAQVNIDEIEESILRRLVAEMRNSLADARKEYDKKIIELKEKLDEKQQNLRRYIQENTEKLNLLLILEEEKNELDKILRIQKYRLEEAIEVKPDLYKKDVEKLIKIKNEQIEQIESLKQEIKMLSLKSRPLPPIAKLSKTSIPEERTESLEHLDYKASGVSFAVKTLTDKEGETESGLQIWDPIGIRGLLNEIVESMPIEHEKSEVVNIGTVRQILLEIIEQLEKKISSKEDVTTIQDVLEEVLQQITGSEYQSPSVKNIVTDIVNNITQDIPEDHAIYIKNIVYDVVDQVLKTDDLTSNEIINEISDRIISSIPESDVPQGTEEIIQEMANQLRSSITYDPIAAAKQVVCDIITSLQSKEEAMEHEYETVLHSCIGKLTNEIDVGKYNDDVKDILRYVIEIMTTKLLSKTKGSKTDDIMESILSEIHPGERSFEKCNNSKKCI